MIFLCIFNFLYNDQENRVESIFHNIILYLET